MMVNSITEFLVALVLIPVAVLVGYLLTGIAIAAFVMFMSNFVDNKNCRRNKSIT